MLPEVGTATSNLKKYTAAITIAWTTGNHLNNRERAGANRQPSPIPRKLASRMKFEKYESSRMYAGIHRISAISRNRTRKEARKVRVGRMRRRLYHPRLKSSP